MLVLVGSAAIAFAAIRRLISHGTDRTVGIGIAVIAFSAVVEPARVGVRRRVRPAGSRSPALEGDAAHLRTDARDLGGRAGGADPCADHRAQWIDPAVALVVAAAIVVTGVRLLTRAGQVLVDQSLPADEVDGDPGDDRGVRDPRGGRLPRAAHAAAAGSRRYVDLHVQFRHGTSLEDAHRTAHELQDVIDRASAAPTS